MQNDASLIPVIIVARKHLSMATSVRSPNTRPHVRGTTCEVRARGSMGAETSRGADVNRVRSGRCQQGEFGSNAR